MKTANEILRRVAYESNGAFKGQDFILLAMEEYANQFKSELPKDKEEGKPLSEWISVEKRLPEDYQEVLIYACTKEGLQVLTAMFCDDTDSQFTIHNYNKNRMGNIKDISIIYWMPLPEPPVSPKE